MALDSMNVIKLHDKCSRNLIQEVLSLKEVIEMSSSKDPFPPGLWLLLCLFRHLFLKASLLCRHTQEFGTGTVY